MTEPSLKRKTVGALLWNILDRMGQQLLLFVMGIIVANLLSVTDYALVGMLAIFSAIGNLLIDSGFSSALIQRKNVSDREYSSVFWLNIGLSITIYLVLVACSPLISLFFNQPKLIALSFVTFLVIPIYSLTLIQSTILTKEIKFKQLTTVNISAMLGAAISSLTMAYSGCGVWTLAVQPVIYNCIRAVMLWIFSSWRPMRVYDYSAIKSLFGFASSLLLAGLINTIFLNIYSVIIGRMYPARQLGLYTQGNKMCEMGVSTLYSSIQNATFPILSSIQNEKERLIRACRKTIRFTSFVTFPAMLGLAIIAKPFIQLLLKEEWWQCVPFLQLLCIGGCFTILTAVNNNFIKVSGRSEGILKIEYIKIAITLVILLLTFRYSVLIMVSGLVVARFVVYVANMIYTSRYTGYSFMNQLHDVMPYLLLSTVMVAAVYPLSYIIENNLLLIVAQMLVGAVVYIGISYVTGSQILREAISLIHHGKEAQL